MTCLLRDGWEDSITAGAVPNICAVSVNYRTGSGSDLAV